MTYKELLKKAIRDFQHNNISRREYLEMTKPLDEEVRKTGKWEETRYRSYDPQSCETYDDGIGFRCSNCANAFKVESLARYCYCPSCGAKMDIN